MTIGGFNGGMRAWFSAAELASLALPGVPRTKRKVNEMADAQRWQFKEGAAGKPLFRKRDGRGGGWEYHVELLPTAARAELVKRGLTGAASVTVSPSVAAPGTDAPELSPTSLAWARFERLSDGQKAKAKARLKIVNEVEAFERIGRSRSSAVELAAASNDCSPAAVWDYLRLVAGVDYTHRLPMLAPCNTGGGREAEIDETVWQAFKSDWLRPEKPTFASCYDRAKLIAAGLGVEIPHVKTFRRKIEREVDPSIILLKREGEEALRRSIPSLQRSVAELTALECVNIDGHRVDVFVRFPDGIVRRPMVTAIQDVFSRKHLVYRVGEQETAVITRLVFADLFAKYGIPRHVIMDNGRAYASKWITGGILNRFRFKVKPDEPLGLLTVLDIQTHPTIPYRGQSKPIERSFKDFCDAIAKHPAFAGAYTGNKTDAKPENYGSHAVPYETFCRIFELGIQAHNAKPGRRTEAARGRSFDDAFAESYATAPIRKAAAEHLRLALLTGEQVRFDRQTGALKLFGNRYWSPELATQPRDKPVLVRFDPDNLMLDLHVYSAGGEYLGAAPVLEAAGFLDAAAAKKQAKLEKDYRNAVKRRAEAHELLAAHEIAALLPDYVDEAPLPSPQVISPVRHRGHTAAALKPVEQFDEAAPANISFLDNFSAGTARLRVVD